MDFIAPKNQSSPVKLIGVGGGGVNVVNHMCRQGIVGVDFFVCDDDCHIELSPVPTKIHLETGSSHPTSLEVHDSVVQSAGTIKAFLSENTRLLFIVAGLGGTTGTVATPVIAEIAKKIETNDPHMPEVLVVAIVAMPFRFEGKTRMEQAQEGLDLLRSKVDSIIIIDNNKVFMGERIKFSQCFAKADDVLLTAAKSVAEMITVNSYMNVDLRDVNSVMSKSGTAIMGSGIASGEKRAIEAVEEAMKSPLLNDIDITDSQKILLHITCSQEYEADSDEIEEITEKITTTCKNSPNLKMGIGIDDTLGENLRVILVATGFQSKTASLETPGGVDWNSIKGKKPKDFRSLDEEKEEKTTTVISDFVQHPKVEQPQEEVHRVESEPQQPRVIHELNAEPVVAVPEPTVMKTELEKTPIDTMFTVTNKSDNNTIEQQSKPQHEPEMRAFVQPQTAANQQEDTSTHTIVDTFEEEKNPTKDLVNSRMADIRKLKQLMSTPGGLAALEGRAAYERKGLKLESVPEAGQSEVSRNIVNKDGAIVPNTFVFTSVD